MVHSNDKPKDYKDTYKQGYNTGISTKYIDTKKLINNQLKPLLIKLKYYKQICIKNKKGQFWNENTIEFKKYIATKNQIKSLQMFLDLYSRNYEFKIKKEVI